MESVVENITRETEKPIDRSKVCPVLVRVFMGSGRHNNISDYARGKTPSHELQLYTWLDASLKELTSLIRVTGDEGRRKGSRFEFSVVYADARSQAFRMREIGSTTAGISGLDDHVTLGSKKFQYGDYLDVAVTNPRRFNNQPYRTNRPRQFAQ